MEPHDEDVRSQREREQPRAERKRRREVALPRLEYDRRREDAGVALDVASDHQDGPDLRGAAPKRCSQREENAWARLTHERRPDLPWAGAEALELQRQLWGDRRDGGGGDPDDER